MPIPTKVNRSKATDGPAYASFDGKNKSKVIDAHNETLESFASIQTQKSTAGNYGIDVATDVSVRQPFNKYDYDMFRPNEMLPRRFRDVVYACRLTYLRLGIVRNVVDMLTDFATEDLRLVHPDKKVEAFLKVWMSKVKLKECVDEFVRHFMVDGNVVVKRTTATLSKPVENQWMDKAMAKPDKKLYTADQKININTREIPWQYSFLNVAALEWIGGDYSAILPTDERKLAFRVSKSLFNIMNTPGDPFQQSLVNRLPADVLSRIKNNDIIELDMNKVYVSHNKKDSWESWAPPYLFSILGDVQFRDKLRQAENSALDGVINVIRLWKLGDHTNGILPKAAAIDKLLSILEMQTGGGAIDLVWDSMIDMVPFYPPIDKILGSEKYVQVNRDILIGLGVPEVLIGGEGANFSNSYIQLKTMVEKLQRVRDSVTTWLDGELDILCEAMEIPMRPRVRFNQMSLEDEGVYRKLIVGLLDRNVVSAEAVLDAYGEDFLLEVERMRQQKDTFKKLGVQIKSPFDKTTTSISENGDPSGGRPSQTQDVGRNARTPKPRTTGSKLTLFALDAIDIIDEYVMPAYMESLQISNARKMTSEQKDEANYMRVVVLASLTQEENLTKDRILEIAENANPNQEIVDHIEMYISTFASEKGTLPTLAQRKRIEAIAWADYFEKIKSAVYVLDRMRKNVNNPMFLKTLCIN